MTNVGSPDRIMRAIVGVVLILLPFVTAFGSGSAVLTWGSIIAGAILALTAVFWVLPDLPGAGSEHLQEVGQ